MARPLRLEFAHGLYHVTSKVDEVLPFAFTRNLPQRPLLRALLFEPRYFFFSCGVTKPIDRFFVSGGRINSRIALSTPAIA